MERNIVFIQSVSEKEWEIGEIQNEEIIHNPNYSDCESNVYYIKTFEDLRDLLTSISDNNRDSLMIIQIDAHSNHEGLAFRDVNNPNKEECNDYVKWSEFNDILVHLYNTLGTNITLIFISCYSSVFAESIKSPHISIIAAEGEIAPRRAGEHLNKFYEKICTGKSVEEAFNFMMESFPLEEEFKRNINDRAILKLYM